MSESADKRPVGRPSEYDPAYRDLLTVPEAQRLSGAFVYGLADDDGEIFYVGRTCSARRRFDTHKNGRGSNAGLNRKVAALGDRLRVAVLVWEPADVAAAERAEIKKREGSLVNLVLSDHQSWSYNSDLPWSAGQRHHSPTHYILEQCGPAARRETRARLEVLTEIDRCWAELEALASMRLGHRRRFREWWNIAGPKVSALLGIEQEAVARAL